MSDTTNITIEAIRERLENVAGEIWDNREAPRGHGGEWVEVANTNGTLIADVFNRDDAEFIANAPADERYLLAKLDAANRRIVELEAKYEPILKSHEREWLRRAYDFQTRGNPFLYQAESSDTYAIAQPLKHRGYLRTEKGPGGGEYWFLTDAGVAELGKVQS